MRFPAYGLMPIPPRPTASREEVTAWRKEYKWWFDAEDRHERMERHAAKRKVIKRKRLWQTICNCFFDFRPTGRIC